MDTIVIGSEKVGARDVVREGKARTEDGGKEPEGSAGV